MGPDADHNEIFQGSRGSIGRAENMVDNLLDAAVDLASIVNRFKKDELQARLDEIENSDLADAESRKAAMDKVAHISAVLADLEKNVRWTLPKWRVKGI
ncbi:hypothetical protein SAMN05444340_1435 [Citreimonas salinaria]|uniref:Uncharacterized protein n=2 Tax=Citreimonas salinaria TaxID=321339 RepID=A0A1H3P1Y9_9RHOB|nr:hypothetical protein SAMN05444340_1435 [Citreimonas salinaria]